MKTLFIGTNNLHKFEEIKDILNRNDVHFNLLCAKDYPDNDEPYEDGKTFEENAIIKAKFYYDKYHLPCIGEDSGICIEYLNNLPGIHSKRFLYNLDNESKNNKVLDLLKNVKNRKACFATSLCYIDENGNIHIFEGINYGEISYSQKGDKGFGYDPIFLIPEFGKTEAELGQEYKNENSHRAKAFSKFAEYIKNEEN